MRRLNRWRPAIGRLLEAVPARRRLVVRLAVWSAVAAVPTFLSGRIVAVSLDRGFLDGRTGTGFLWLGMLAATVPVGAWGIRQAYRKLADIVEPVRDDLVEQTVEAALRRSTAPGAPPDTAGAARVAQHVEIVREALANVLIVVQEFVITTSAALLGLLALAPLALLFVLPPLACGLAVFVAVLARMAAQQRVLIDADERLAEEWAAAVSGIRDVVACGGEDLAYGSIDRHVGEQARATVALGRLSGLRSSAVAIAGLLPLVLMVLFAPWLTRRGLSTGALIGCLTYLLQALLPAVQTLVRELGNTALWLVVASRRIFEHSAVNATDGASANGGPGPAGYQIELRGVDFRYGASALPVVAGLDLTVPEGDHLAIVGPSGVGKSTLAGLLTGVLRPGSGEVRIGGVPVSGLDREAQARRRTLIPQEAYVFAGTLRENLAYYRARVTHAELQRAVDELGMAALVTRLGGFDAHLAPGSLSAGERQLITLARAFLSDAPVLVLDEASCHLDPAREAVVERALARRPGTLIVIAHRMSSAVRAKRVLVMDGAAALLGTNEELREQSSLYRELTGLWT